MGKLGRDTRNWSSGDVYSIRLEDGRFGAVRILTPGKSGASWKSIPIVGITYYVGNSIPTTGDRSLRKVRKGQGPSGQSELLVYWISERPTADVTFVGNIAISRAITEPKCYVLGSWPLLAARILYEWRKQYDPKALARAAEVERRRQLRLTRLALKAEKERLAGLTLSSLHGSEPFTAWRGAVSSKLIRASNNIYKRAVAALIELGPDRSPSDARLVLRDYIDDFNILDAKSDHFIETSEREAIIDALRDITVALGLPKLIAVERYRDW